MADALLAEFEKRLPGGLQVRATVRVPSDSPVTVLFGRSGAGKTTLLRCLAGLERPDHGHIRCGGDTWFDSERGIDLSPQRRNLGLMVQDYGLFPHLDVRGNIAYGLAGLTSEERDRRVASQLELLELTNLAHRRISKLSGGEKQRVALARAMAREPKLLLLDEPLSALDAPTRERLRASLRPLLVASGTPALIVTHDRTEARVLGDQVVVVVDGMTVQTGPVAQVFAHPLDARVAELVGAPPPAV